LGRRLKQLSTPLPPINKQTTELEIAAYTVGELKPHDASINLSNYDPAWPSLFEREAQRIREALGKHVMQLEHVGSTSVPGLAAKPQIDILLVVPDSSDEPTYVPALEGRGYVLRMREPDWYEHRVFKRRNICGFLMWPLLSNGTLARPENPPCVSSLPRSSQTEQ
jgi:hypothetical protein